MEDYYTDNDKKIKDFVISFFGFLAFLFIIISLSMSIFVRFESFIHYSFLLIIGIVAAIISSIVVAFKLNRRYIGIGMILALLIPLLIFGACVGIASVVLRGI